MNFELSNQIEILGFLAGALTTISFLPQVIKTWNSKSAEDVSVVMFILFISGVGLWCAYGWEIHSISIVVANVITFILASIILLLKVVFENFSQINQKE